MRQIFTQKKQTNFVADFLQTKCDLHRKRLFCVLGLRGNVRYTYIHKYIHTNVYVEAVELHDIADTIFH